MLLPQAIWAARVIEIQGADATQKDDIHRHCSALYTYPKSFKAPIMTTSPAEYLVVGEDEGQPRRRALSSGYLEDIKEKERRERRDRERRIQRYHDGSHPSQSSSHHRSSSDRLRVPIFETSPRRTRTIEAAESSQATSPGYHNVQEVRPGPKPIYDVNSEPILPSQMPVRSKPPYRKKPSIKVEIHQESPPSPTAARGTATKRPSDVELESIPAAQSLIQHQYETLQHKLSQTSSACSPYLEFGAVDPGHLTFAKIAEQVTDFAFELRVWADAVCLQNLVTIDIERRETVKLASKDLNHLIKSTEDLRAACEQARPQDLKTQASLDVNEGTLFKDDNPDLRGNLQFSDSTENIGYIIQSSLRSIAGQVRSLKLLTTPPQESTLEHSEEATPSSRLADGYTRHAGSPDA